MVLSSEPTYEDEDDDDDMVVCGGWDGGTLDAPAEPLLLLARTSGDLDTPAFLKLPRVTNQGQGAV
jgi:hypothetical protein